MALRSAVLGVLRFLKPFPEPRIDLTEEAPLRSELFSTDQMAQHGKRLAGLHRLDPTRTSDQLLARLASNENALVGICELLSESIIENRRITPAGEWLLDNFYLIEEHIRTAKRHLPKGYSRELPRLEGNQASSSAGHPRVYDIALEIVSHGDGRVDTEVLDRFLTAYQTITPLKLGELWATPIMLRLAIIENLRRVGIRLSAGRGERNLADEWADRITETVEKDPKSLILIIADMARSDPPMVSAFVAELARRLQGRGPALAMPLAWIEQQLAESGLTIEQLIQSENQQQAADQVSISNSIGSLRILGSVDWRKFVEKMSVVEQTLHDDPAGLYGQMDFTTRDNYRHVVERLARDGALSEEGVARKAIELARSVNENANGIVGAVDRAAHVGHYLIGKGLPNLEHAAAVKLSLGDRIHRTVKRTPLSLYLGAIALATAIISVILIRCIPEETRTALATGWGLWVFGFFALLVASRPAVTLVNWLATLLMPVDVLPRMDYSEGIPERSRTLVVVPAMLTSVQGIEALVEALEIRFLGNRDAFLYFALLTDFCDAAQASLPEDATLVDLVRTRIIELNTKYGRLAPNRADDVFFLFHRPRLWNPNEGCWMGYERKRGKLAALNGLLRSAQRQGEPYGFSVVVGNTAVLAGTKYVITLDSDTQLPRDAARQFVGAMAHPLNRPRYDPEKQRVVEGYGILQPRVSISLAGTKRSRFAHLHSGETGIDPYTRAVSDVYQDVFGEGSFIGKGIYDVEVFEQALCGRFPENLILSHDLLEGCYVRSGLLSDVHLYEDYPVRYDADVSRRYRWIRGDWQLAGWLLWRVPCARRSPGVDKPENTQKNPLSALSKWKLFDNLRRSVLPTALLVLLLSAWAFLPRSEALTLGLLGLLLIPGVCCALYDVLNKPDDESLKQHCATVANATYRQGKQLAFELTCLPYEAYFSTMAIVQTIWRMRVTGKGLLEWSQSSEADRLAGFPQSSSTRRGLAGAFRTMWIAPVTALITAIALLILKPAVLAVALPILLLWFAAPAITWWMSLPLFRKAAELTVVQTLFLQGLARRTWAFFDHFVGAEDHYLPPDNVQDFRGIAIAHRTSPTNMGLVLLSYLSAYDFGYIHGGDLLKRVAETLGSMQKLARFRGHFYNWYDTQTMHPLGPLYISAVDSGNLAAHLLTLRAGLLAVGNDRILPDRMFSGLGDTFRILAESANELDPQIANPWSEFREMHSSVVATPPLTLAAAQQCLEALSVTASALATRLADHADATTVTSIDRSDKGENTAFWAQALVRQCHTMLEELALYSLESRTGSSPLAGIPTLHELAQRGHAIAIERLAAFAHIALQCGELANMEYDFLFDKKRQLLNIGYNVAEQRLDAGYYDLLASEARLCSFVAIAQGQLPQDNWFALGRLRAGTGAEPVLLSWSGSMFEYLMPLLIMPTYDDTLLDQTCKGAVARQIEYGSQHGIPWGMSESAYNTVDVHLNYQYRAFGVPGLGLKRVLADDLVIAPYASALALMVAPEKACLNLQRMADDGFMGKFGFFEAIDYATARQRRGQSYTVVRSCMAHHQGMSLLAMAYLLLNRPMQRRFESERLFQAVMLLLQERIPKAGTLFSHTEKLPGVRSRPEVEVMSVRRFDTPDTPIPEVQLLSNGRYHVMLTNAGGGYSRWKDLAVTRWREDGTRDHWGTFCYVREVTSEISEAFWSVGHQPSLKKASSYEAIFTEGRAEFRRKDAFDGGKGLFETHTEVVVSPEDDIELRRMRITNRSRQRRVIEVTSYAEVVIAPSASDTQHPAFSNLFVQTELMYEHHAILCARRPRSLGEKSPWLLHLMTTHGAEVCDVSYETDRLRFIGRSRSPVAPLAMSDRSALSNTEGAVLDPVVAIRYRMTLDPQKTVTVDMVQGIAENREAAVCLVEKYQDRHLADRVFDLAWTHSQVVLRQINASEADALVYTRLASAILYANGGLRADADMLIRNRRGQSGLWGYAISGDLPIVLLQIGDAANIALVYQLVQAHTYWRLKGISVDLVIWNEDHAGYRKQLQDQIMGLIASGIDASVIDRPGGIFVRQADQISSEDRILFLSVARAVIMDSRGSLEEQLDQRVFPELRIPRFRPVKRMWVGVRAGLSLAQPRELVLGESTEGLRRTDLILFNGLGGFTPDGREYVITLEPGDETPAPWVNVLANPNFGTIVSENGVAYTWSENAHEFRLTPWYNDPVCDSSGEALYLRDEETGQFWSPTPLPARPPTRFTIRHGFGYSVFESSYEGLRSELWVYVAIDAAIKFSVLKIRNDSGRPRRISVTGYVEWVLGDSPEKTRMHVTNEIDLATGALLAHNAYSTEFSGRVAFFDVDDPLRQACGDRHEFIGRNGTLRNPASMMRARLSGKVGAALDPCGALQVHFDLASGEEHDVVFRLGVGSSAEEAGALALRFKGAPAARKAMEAVRQYWNHTLCAVQIETPDLSLNVLANGWLVYQTLACRLWARSGYYQSGGAYGFRDQLQDVMALIHTEPDLVREHLLLCASRQFQEGDVQHWWHPPSGRGVRTRCSDDFLWLPLAVCRYVTSCGDRGVLDENIPYLEGRPLAPEDESYYDMPSRSSEQGCLYQHCVRAIRHGLTCGEHGLPLMGSGDWNDGMNRVGIQGKGESVWLGFFLCEVLSQFTGIAVMRGDSFFANVCQTEGSRIRQALEQHGWDGAWYRRAYFDDGTPLGSKDNTECLIDSISQSWAVLSGAGDLERSRQAMNSVYERLVRREEGLVQLLDPPFDSSTLDPGYIRGYVPGVRENGGQYTHGAVWAAMAFAALGERERAWELLRLINPVNHTLSQHDVMRYRVEPYVVAADVYAMAPHTGRAGWSWYTGSSGWMYRLILESLLGLKRVGETLQLTPCLPADWRGVSLHYRYRETVYHLFVTQADGKDGRRIPLTVTLDGVQQNNNVIALVDDHQTHQVDVNIQVCGASTGLNEPPQAAQKRPGHTMTDQ